MDKIIKEIMAEADWNYDPDLGNFLSKDGVEKLLVEIGNRSMEKFKDIVGDIDDEFLAAPGAEKNVGEWAIYKERQRIMFELKNK